MSNPLQAFTDLKPYEGTLTLALAVIRNHLRNIGAAISAPLLRTFKRGMGMALWLTPPGAVKQPGGRIERAFPDKKQPLIVDPLDGFGFAKDLEMRRKRQYKSYGWTIIHEGN